MSGTPEVPRMPNAVIALDQARIRAVDNMEYWTAQREGRERLVAEKQRLVVEAQHAIDECQHKVDEFTAAIELIEGR